MVSRLAPAPETKPGTVEGWVVREVVGGTAVLVGPYGERRVRLGDAVPGLGKVDSIVLDVGGFLGMGDTKYAIPWKFFEVDQQGRVTASKIDKETLRSAPKVIGPSLKAWLEQAK